MVSRFCVKHQSLLDRETLVCRCLIKHGTIWNCCFTGSCGWRGVWLRWAASRTLPSARSLLLTLSRISRVRPPLLHSAHRFLPFCSGISNLARVQTVNVKCRSCPIAGVAQGVITGIRGLCNGLGPALFGFIFYLFHVDLNDSDEPPPVPSANKTPSNLEGRSLTLHQIHEVSRSVSDKC